MWLLPFLFFLTAHSADSADFDFGDPEDRMVEVFTDSPEGDEKDALAVAVEKIFRERKCASCHRSSGDAADKFNILDVKELLKKKKVNLSKPLESLLYQQVTGTKPKMPRDEPPLSSEETEKILKWIEAGAPPFKKK